jgi:hypothetical protein
MSDLDRWSETVRIPCAFKDKRLHDSPRSCNQPAGAKVYQVTCCSPLKTPYGTETHAENGLSILPFNRTDLWLPDG